MKSFRFLLLLLTITFVFGCNEYSNEQPKETKLIEEPQEINKEIAKLLFKKLSPFDTTQILYIEYDSLFATKFILDFYSIKKHTPIFTDKGLLNKQGDTLLALIKNAEDYGLIPKDYHYNKINALLKTAKDSSTKKYNAVKLLNADLLLTDAFFTMAVHVNKGRLNKDSLTLEWKGDQMDTNVVEILNIVLSKNEIHAAIDSLEIKNTYYLALKQSLKNFKYEFKGIDWDSVASKESDSTTFMFRIKERLIKSHDYVDIPGISDSMKLVKAIKNFQCKHNLIEDGKIGKLTFKSLQRTKQDYINQIALNMERWRWYTPPTEKRYVWVNIPKFEMKVIEDDTLVMKSRIIVGSLKHPTPILKSTIRYFLIYPYWNVPFSIATKEILPILKRDTSYLTQHNFEVLDGNNQKVDPTKIKWKKYSKTYFPYRLRQEIGQDNSLGIIKFNFENKYGVYMHDTDNRRLFGKEMRALSHGCCRLEKYMEFTKFLIRDDSLKYPTDSLYLDLIKEEQKYVYLKKAIVIYINYFTVEVDKNGELHYFFDVYDRDKKMIRSLRRE